MIFPLVGNSKINAAITCAIKENRLPHAILIEGDKGTGRHTLARFISSAAVCSGENPPCDECRNCKLFANDNHPDITITAPIDGKKNISVAQIRELRLDAFVKPHEARRRVFIIDNADSMNEQAQNALLKILEEPPETVMFILIAESKSAFLDTVISRCVILTLSCPDRQTAAEYISANTDFSEDDIINALDNKQNNIGNALKLLQGAADTKTGVAAEEYLERMLRSDIFGMLSISAPFEKSRIDAELFFKDLKYKTALRLRKSLNTPEARLLSGFYNELSSLEKSLITNVNLSLLFCTLASKSASQNK